MQSQRWRTNRSVSLCVLGGAIGLAAGWAAWQSGFGPTPAAADETADVPQSDPFGPPINAGTVEIPQVLRFVEPNLSPALGSQATKAEAPKPTVDELRRRYPYKSLDERLAHEKRRGGAPAPVRLSETARQRLDALDRPWEESKGEVIRFGHLALRTRSLEMLHSEKAEEFVNAEGFGVGRMLVPQPSPDYLEPPQAEPIRLATVPELSHEYDSPQVVALPAADALPAANPLRLPPQQKLLMLHAVGETSFLNPNSFGHVRSRREAAGFQSHSFLWEPKLPTNPPAEGEAPPADSETWLLRRLELVSLLKHDVPAAYVSEHLPRMDELADAPTRPLTDWEHRGLRTLRGGEDLAVEATPNRIRMLGALRASNRCVQCHEAERGALLGAFTYELQRDPPLRIRGAHEPPAI